ncbi:MAG: hypothetical protein ACUVTH_12290 [Thermogutta sp.]
MIASETLTEATGYQLVRLLHEHHARCREVLSRQQERFRLVEQELVNYINGMLQTLESEPRESAKNEAHHEEKILPLLAALESAARTIQEKSETLRHEDEDRSQSVAQLMVELAAMRQELAELRAIKDRLEQQLAAESHAQGQNDAEEWQRREAELRAEFELEKNHWRAQWNDREAAFNALVIRCGELEEELENLRQRNSSEVNADLQRRYEMAIAEIRELRHKNADLEKRIAQAEHSPAKPTAGSSGGQILDWEAEKQRILAALEAEAESDSDPQHAAERIRIQDVIRKTENALAAKDKEIAELRRLLEDQSTNIGSVAVGAAAIERLFDQDEVLREQREHLRQLEEEWKEKLRKAELEISLERAKIARERAILEEKQRELEEKLASLRSPKVAEDDKTKSGRGRWLNRLGISNSGHDQRDNA